MASPARRLLPEQAVLGRPALAIVVELAAMELLRGRGQVTVVTRVLRALMGVHERGHVGLLEDLVLHDVAPVARGVAAAEKDEAILPPRPLQGHVVELSSLTAGIESLQVKLHREMLRQRNSQLLDYGTLDAAAARIAALGNSLDAAVSFDDDEELAQHIDRLKTSIETQTALIEDFKTHDSAAQNSLRSYSRFYSGIEANDADGISNASAEMLGKLQEVWLNIARSEAAKRGAPDAVKSAEYRGVTGWTSGGDDAHCIVGNRLLLSNKPAALKDMLDLRAGSGGRAIADSTRTADVAPV